MRGPMPVTIAKRKAETRSSSIAVCSAGLSVAWSTSWLKGARLPGLNANKVQTAYAQELVLIEYLRPRGEESSGNQSERPDTGLGCRGHASRGHAVVWREHDVREGMLTRFVTWHPRTGKALGRSSATQTSASGTPPTSSTCPIRVGRTNRSLPPDAFLSRDMTARPRPVEPRRLRRQAELKQSNWLREKFPSTRQPLGQAGGAGHANRHGFAMEQMPIAGQRLEGMTKRMAIIRTARRPVSSRSSAETTLALSWQLRDHECRRHRLDGARLGQCSFK